MMKRLVRKVFAIGASIVFACGMFFTSVKSMCSWDFDVQVESAESAKLGVLRGD